jgi:hypothetical protein
MRHRIRPILSLHYRPGFALLAALLLGACASANTETIRTKNLLAAAGFHTQKPETPSEREIYNRMPAHTLEGGLIRGTQLYTYKYPSEGAVYVGGENEYQQYAHLLAYWKKAGEKIMPRKTTDRSLPGPQYSGDAFWLKEYR